MIKEYSYLHKIKYIINRVALVSGPWQFGKQEQGFVSLWVWRHLNRLKLSYIGFGGTGRQVRDVLHIEDLCELVLLQIQKFKKINNKLINVGGGKKNSLNLIQLTKFCKDITNNTIKINSVKKTSLYDTHTQNNPEHCQGTPFTISSLFGTVRHNLTAGSTEPAEKSNARL